VHICVLVNITQQTAAEAIENIRTVQFLTREKKFLKDFVAHLKKPHDAAIREARIQVVDGHLCITLVHAYRLYSTVWS
jgi:hypothetical protein